jgi:hypothetical protein
VAAADGVAVTLRDITLQQQAEERLKQITPYDLWHWPAEPAHVHQHRLDHALRRAKRVQRWFWVDEREIWPTLGRAAEADGEVIGHQGPAAAGGAHAPGTARFRHAGPCRACRFMVILEDERDLAGADVVARTLMKRLLRRSTSMACRSAADGFDRCHAAGLTSARRPAT